MYGEDILNLPYPEKISDIKLSPAETIIISDALAYQLNADNKERLNDCVNEQNLKAFARVFETTLNTVYKADGKKFQLYKILDTGSYYALHFEYASNSLNASLDRNAKLEEYLETLIPVSQRKKSSIHIQRILKFYRRDSIVLAKPKQLRYWLQSIALRDADETFADYFKAGF